MQNCIVELEKREIMKLQSDKVFVVILLTLVMFGSTILSQDSLVQKGKLNTITFNKEKKELVFPDFSIPIGKSTYSISPNGKMAGFYEYSMYDSSTVHILDIEGKEKLFTRWAGGRIDVRNDGSFLIAYRTPRSYMAIYKTFTYYSAGGELIFDTGNIYGTSGTYCSFSEDDSLFVIIGRVIEKSHSFHEELDVFDKRFKKIGNYIFSDSIRCFYPYKPRFKKNKILIKRNASGGIKETLVFNKFGKLLERRKGWE